MISAFKRNDSFSLNSLLEAPILTQYLPASAIQADSSELNEARSPSLIVNVSVSDSPGFNKAVLENPFSSSDGLSSPSPGALRYNCTTSLPATSPVLVTVTVAVIESLNLEELTYIDSSGIGSLIRYMNIAIKENIDFICYNLNKNIENIFQISKLDQFLHILSNDDYHKKYETLCGANN